MGDRGDPRGGDPRESGESVAQPGEGRDARQCSRDGGRGGRRIGHEVGGDPQQWHVRIDQHDQRAADELGRRGHGEPEGEGARHPPLQPDRKGPRERQEGSSGARRQGESE
ncbi:hypothetical protein CHE218_04160 [Microbacterium sp. che218]